MQNVTIDRDKYIGGSDIPIIMGISPFKTRFDLLLEKAGLKDNDFTGNEYTEYGNIMEEKIRNYINEEDDKVGIGGGFIEYKKIDGDIRCHLDGYNEHEVLEIKTTSQIHNYIDEYRVYLVQLLFYMNQVKCEKGLLAVYERPSDFNQEFNSKNLSVFSIDINDYTELLQKIYKAVDQFRVDLEKLKENPLLSEADLMPTDLTELSNKIIALENKLVDMKKIEVQAKELKTQLKTAMQENNIKSWETPTGVKITLIADGTDKEVQKFNEDKFKEEHEKMYKKYLENSMQKGKAGYVKITLPKGE